LLNFTASRRRFAYFRIGVVAPDWPSELGVVELVAPCALPEP
jgi:hypothetical protein